MDTTTFSVLTIQTLDELEQAWNFAAPILNLPPGDNPVPLGKYTLPFYIKALVQTPNLLIFARQDGHVCGCVLASIEDDHVLVGPVAVEENARRRGIGSAMMWKLEIEARALGQNTLIHEGLEEREMFYQRCGYKANLYIQVPESCCVEKLEALNPNLPVTRKGEVPGKSRLMLRTQQINKDLQEKYNQAFPSCSSQYIFIKEI
jgi:GNAT superfamily N-acetyltransferase